VANRRGQMPPKGKSVPPGVIAEILMRIPNVVVVGLTASEWCRAKRLLLRDRVAFHRARRSGLLRLQPPDRGENPFAGDMDDETPF